MEDDLHVKVKVGKETFDIKLPSVGTIGDLQMAIAQHTYIPPLGQKLCGIRGAAETPLAQANPPNPQKVMVIGTPATDIKCDKALKLSPAERIQRIVWGLRSMVDRPGPNVDPKTLHKQQEELCTLALMELDGVETEGDEAVREQRKAAIGDVHGMAARLEAQRVE
mmetsp:Transcript_132693/g.230100  ORF Transcript_132693/g.230100 Transcript_132693/m.230100 type:complete len:166 (-) Transcript_132693:19-516(-)